MNNVISLKALREIRQAEKDDSSYLARIREMDKLELLEEMVRFQEERSAAGELSLSMMVRGKILFRALEDSAETRELQLLTGSYRRHLEHELAVYTGQAAPSESDIESELEIELDGDADEDDSVVHE